MFGFFSTQKTVSKIQQGKYLENATPMSVQHCFALAMKNPPRKALVGIWLPLHEQGEWVYWGEPVFKGLFSKDRVVEELYKVSKKELEQNWPSYKKQTGNQLRLKLSDYIRQYELKGSDKNYYEKSDGTKVFVYVTVNFSFSAKLDGNTVVATVPTGITYMQNEEKTTEKKRFKLILERDTFVLKHLEAI